MSQPRDDRQDDLFRPLLEEIINLRHPLVRLAGEIISVRSVHYEKRIGRIRSIELQGGFCIDPEYRF